MVTANEVLNQYWGYTAFRGSQEKVIEHILQGKDVLALLPTGGGKSICYQVPAMTQDGICIVISPLIALIQDQVQNLKNKGIKAIAITGGISEDDLIDAFDNCLYGNYKFLYLSPERLTMPLVQEKLQELPVNLIAIDEAHCISQWGNDFRPAYLQCGILKELAPSAPVIALTATATKVVSNDIIESLQLTNPILIKDSFSRKNIGFHVLKEEDKLYRTQLLCSKVKTSAIVYVRSRKLSEQIAQYLNQKNGMAIHFHGGLSKAEKQKALDLWLANKVQTVVATNAFGMGIDKPDVSLVIHYQTPDSIENYYQEAGRAGRDGQAAKAILLTNQNDAEHLKNQFLSVLPDTTFIKTLYKKLNNYFQIAYGEGSGNHFYFKLNSFCDTYQLNVGLTYNGLKMLDQHGVISLSETFHRRTTIQFIAPKQELFQYLEKHPKDAPIIQNMLRTYGGLYDYPTKINTLLLSKKSLCSEEKIIWLLQQMQKDGIITYESIQGDIEITFLVPREDDITIHAFGHKIDSLRRVKIRNIEHMLHYVATDTVCRSTQLLHYFGEVVNQNCGICDVCLSKQKLSQEDTQMIDQMILRLLSLQPLSSRELIEKLQLPDAVLLQSLQRLLEEHKIDINLRNQYIIK